MFSDEDDLPGHNILDDDTSQKLMKDPMDKKKIKFGTKLSNINVNQSQSKMKIKDENNLNEAVRLRENSSESFMLVTKEIDMVLIPTTKTTAGI